ncbi:hypothetical protein EcE24377A_1526 [Escherichia coli O139:H28 str. E24377A]|uniref:Uncharacterized protein n=1 Tax=Escherichia coli O139:H28 (strain E24377A / ETEC) TaxID=331111 RepID=A7ZLE5_ECO24|nr:hypothetical protein EcE24377A_1526 [Escherichia coli O139:H28 str. E24377A]
MCGSGPIEGQNKITQTENRFFSHGYKLTVQTQ